MMEVMVDSALLFLIREEEEEERMKARCASSFYAQLGTRRLSTTHRLVRNLTVYYGKIMGYKRGKRSIPGSHSCLEGCRCL